VGRQLLWAALALAVVVVAWLLEAVTLCRSALLEMPYGDQAFALTRTSLHAAGGVPLLPWLEDYELASRLRRVGRIVTLPAYATTSARRFEERGVWRQCVVNQLALLAYSTGVASPQRIGAWFA